jgi:hypothetical protein
MRSQKTKLGEREQVRSRSKPDFDEAAQADAASVAVAYGAAFLAEHVPGYRQKLDVNGIDVLSSTRCPLGQVFGKYMDGCTVLGLSQEQAGRLGFVDPSEGAECWRELNQAWREELA